MIKIVLLLIVLFLFVVFLFSLLKMAHDDEIMNELYWKRYNEQSKKDKGDRKEV